MRNLKRFFFSVVLLTSVGSSLTNAQTFSPPNIAGLSLWLRADSGITQSGGTVSQWNDVSGHGLNATQATQASQPGISNDPALNNLPALMFNGTSDQMSGPQINALNDSSVTVFIVNQGNAQGGLAAGIFDVGDNNTGMWVYRHMYDGTFFYINNYGTNGSTFGVGGMPNAGYPYRVFEMQKIFKTSVSLYVNGVSGGSMTDNSPGGLAGTFTNSGYVLGNAAGFSFLNGAIAEIVVYNRALTDQQRAQVETYLYNKYAPPVNLGPDISQTNSLCPVTLNAGSRFVSYAWSTGATTATISAAQNGNYSVTATDIFGRTSSDTVHVALPSLVLNVGDTSVCLGSSLKVATTLTNTTGFTFLWSNGQTTASINVASAGTYSVKATTSGCSANSNTITIAADSFKNQVAMVADTGLCAGNQIGLSSPSQSVWSNLKFMWSNGSTQSVIPVNTAGTYSVTVTDAAGCKGTASSVVSISGTAPTLNFAGDTACLGLVYNPHNATDTTSQHLTGYVWNFGDNSPTGTTYNPAHTYQNAGTYTVNLKVTTSAGCSNNLSRQVLINALPLAAFQTGSGCINQQYQFTDLSTAPAGQQIQTWNWTFGDNGTSSSQNPAHTYISAKSYNVTLQVSDLAGCSNSVTHAINVVSSAALPQAPVLQSPANNTTIGNTTVNFTWGAAVNAVTYTLVVSPDPGFATSDSTYANLSAPQQNVILPSAPAVYYWKVTAYNVCDQSTTSAVDSFSIFNPAAFQGLTLWLRGDSGVVQSAGNVSQWKDVSGKGYNASQPTPGQQPTFSNVPLLNNLPALMFNGSSDQLMGTQINGLNDSSMTVFIVNAGLPQTGLAAGIFDIGDNGTGMWLYRRMYSGNFTLVSNYNANEEILDAPGMPNTGYPYKVFEMQRTFQNSATLYVNGAFGASMPDNSAMGIAGAFTNNSYLIGNAAGFSFLNGAIAEIIVYNQALTNGQRQQVENYLYNKYAPPVNLGPDITVKYGFCPVQLNAGNRFASYLWSTGDTLATTMATQAGNYWVRVVDVFGHTSSDTVHVAFPNVNLFSTDSTICAGASITVATQLTDSTHYSFVWNTGAKTATISASTAGPYFVSVKDTGGCSAKSDTMALVLDNFKSTVSLGADTGLCAGNMIGLSNPSTGWSSLIFNWSTGSTDSTAVVSASGSYSVTVTNTTGCSATASKTVTITGTAPALDFSGDTMCYGIAFAPVNLTNPINSITSWQWDFGDGSTSNVASPMHTFVNSGTFTVSLSAVNNSGCSNKINKPVSVLTLPTANFNGGSACGANSYQFTDASSAPTGSAITSHSWNFGDGNQSAETSPLHQYSSSGVFDVQLTVTDDEGCTGNITKNITAGASGGVPAVSLSVPANGSVFGSGNGIVFGWNPVPGAAQYALEISTDSYFDSPIIYSNLKTNEQVVNNLLPSTTYYWKVESYNACGDSANSRAYNFTVFNPSNSSCLTLWLRADTGVVDSAGLIKQWQDMSGNNYNTTGPARPDSMPTLIPSVPLLNNMPSVNFNGSTNEFYGVPIQGINTSPLTTFIVSKNNGEKGTDYADGLFTIGTRDQGMWIYGRVGTADYTFLNNFQSNVSNLVSGGPNSMPPTGYPYTIWGMNKNYGQQVALYANGALLTTSNNANATGPFTNAPYLIGNTNYNNIAGFDNLHGEIAEIIIYTCSLTDEQQQQVQNYIYTKYAPPVYLGADIIQNNQLCPVTLDAGGRFVSYVWSTGDTTSKIVVNKTGTYYVNVVDVFGRSSSDTINVQLPYAGSNPAGDTVICIGGSVNLTQNISNSNNYTFQWSNGATSSSILVSQPGNYDATITDSGGCKIVSNTISVSLDSFSLTTLVTPDTIICAGGGISLNDGGYKVVSYNWSPGSDTSASFVVQNSGLYNVTVTDIYGCVAHGSVQVTVHGASPSADFTFAGLCLGNTTVFTNQSTPVLPDAIDSFYWDFGGGSPAFSTTQNANTSYQAFGNYSVTLHITTDSGCTASKTEQVTINPRPNASFNYAGPNSNQNQASVICAGTYVDFTDTSITVGGSAITSRLWQFDGVPDSSTNANIFHQFTAQGDYNVTLIVSNTDGCADSLTLPIEVFAPLVADFDYSGTCGGDTTRFIDVTKSFSIVSWIWAFGDGTNSQLQNPLHHYAGPGVNPVSMTIENAIGCTSTVTKYVSIYQNPIAGFTAPATCQNRNYAPVDNSEAFNDPITKWSWNIAGTAYNGQTPQQYFADTGIYTVTLAITTQNGCYDSTSQSIYIEPNPVALFGYTPIYGTAPVNVTFINLSQGADSYFWNFGDNITSTDENPEHTYTEDTSYTVVLVAQNTYGCADTSTKAYVTKATDLDIAVMGVYTNQTPQADGTVLVQVVAQVANLGTRIITSAEFKAVMGSGGALVQQWSGNLLSGQVLIDTIPALFSVSAASANTYVCVTASDVNNGETEISTANNEYCSSLTGTMQLAGPSPNPVGNQSVLGVILPQAGQVYISIYDELGRSIMNEQSFNMPAGVTDFQIPVQQMNGGAAYFIRVRYNYDTEVRKIIVR